MPKVGEKAPGFSGKDQNGNTVSLADFRGKKVVLYFYPKDNTSGCTKQACNLRDGQGTLTASGIAVVGVSADSVKSHGRFADRYDLPFPLIADEDLEIVKRYGVYGEKNLYGIKSLGIKRTTFLIDEDGKILHVFRKPNTGDHTQEILGKLV
jgi:peroxiredoxin Q/BCP